MKIVEISEWRSPEIKTIEVTQDLGGASYKLQVREFVQVDGDALARSWVTGGVTKYYECPPYAIVNMQQAGVEYMQYVDNNIATAIESEIDETNKLLWNTYSMAFRYSVFAQVSSDIESGAHVLIHFTW
jgi:hypothetical protein